MYVILCIESEVQIMKNETIELRKNFLKHFDNYIINVIGDEELIEAWLICGLPDEYTEEEWDFRAKDDDEGNSVVDLCSRVGKEAEGRKKEESVSRWK